MTTLFWIAQAVGLVGLLFSILSYQSKTRKGILTRQMHGSFAYIIHYAMLSAWTGVAMDIIVAVRNWVFMKKDSAPWAKHIGWMYLFMLLPVLVLPFIWEGYISLLPAIAMVLGVYARWQNKASVIRTFSFIGVLLWIPYTLFVSSYAGTLTNVIVGGSILYSMLKNDGLGKRKLGFLGV